MTTSQYHLGAAGFSPEGQAFTWVGPLGGPWGLMSCKGHLAMMAPMDAGL